MSRTWWRPHRLTLLVALPTLVLLLQVAPSAGADRAVAVGQGGDRFTPARVEIVAGDTVVWTNHGGWHNVHGDGFSNDVSESAWTFRHTFDSAGTFEYVCDVHTNMRGTVAVSAAPAPPPAESEPAPEPTTPAPEPTASEPAEEEPTTVAPRPQPSAAAPAEPEPRADGAATPSQEPSPRPTSEPTHEPTGGGSPVAPSTVPTAPETPSSIPQLAVPATGPDGGGGGGMVAAVLAATLGLAAAGGAWFVRARRP